MDMRRVWVLMVLWLAGAGPVLGEVRLPGVFGSGMVVQQGQPIRIWGWADPGEAVRVSLGGHHAESAGDEQGRWRVELPAMTARPPHDPLQLTVTGTNTITLDDVRVGEVWVCSGQSNMQWTVKQSADPDAEIAAGDHPLIRLLTVPREVAAEPAADIRKSAWAACSPQTVGGFSAVGYYFGRRLHQDLGVPIGLISSNWGGTPAEAWTPRPVLGEVLPAAVEREAAARANYPNQVAAYQAKLAEWNKTVADAKAAGQPEPDGKKKPKPPTDPDKSPHMPSVLFNGMIAPLTPMSVRGVIWYQGESNAGRHAEYESLLTAMIQAWRAEFENPDLAFGIVQLANFMAEQTDPGENSDWARLRDAQRRVAASLPGVGLAVAVDIGEAKDIHPKNKQDVGQRLAAWALHETYDRADVVPSGPVFKSLSRRDGELVVSFDHAQGLASRGDVLSGFVVAGVDGKFAFAQAKIEGDAVVVSSPDVPQPVTVRYGWASNPKTALYNGAGLPAVPFEASLPGEGNSSDR